MTNHTDRAYTKHVFHISVFPASAVIRRSRRYETKEKDEKQSDTFQADNASELHSNGSYLESPTVDGPSADLKQIDNERPNNKEVIWGSEIHQDSDYSGDECGTFNDR